MPARTVRDLMTPDPICCPPQTSLDAVARLMLENDCGAIPIIENEQSRRLVGIITDRDIVCRVVAQEIPPCSTMVHQVMTRDVATLRPEAKIEDCVRLMARHQVRRIPIVDASGAIVGIVAQADLARAGADEHRLEDDLTDMVEEVSVPARGG